MQTETPAPERDIVSWDDLERLIAALTERLANERFDLMLAITRGGLVPAGMLAYRLRIRNILVAAVEFYDDDGQPGPRPTFLQFPADPLLRGQRILVVDEVWDSGTTIHATISRISPGLGACPSDITVPIRRWAHHRDAGHITEARISLEQTLALLDRRSRRVHLRLATRRPR